MQDSILSNFRKIVTPDFISKIAIKSKFSQRSTSQVSGLEFIRMLILQTSCGNELSYSNLNATLQKINPNINISNQALAKYFYKPASVNLVRTIYEKIFSFQKTKLLHDVTVTNFQLLSIFNRILIQDSTVCTLNERLKNHYKGCGGSSSKSSLKIDVLHEFKTATILKIGIFAGNKPDISQSTAILEEIQEGDLVLRDLGYCKLDVLAQLTERKAFFVSRYHPRMNVYINRHDVKPIELGSYLKRKYKHLNTIDITVYLGDAKEKLRLIAYRVPSEVSNERRRKAKRNAKCKGRTAGEAYLNLFDYVILITNIPSEAVEAKVIGTIYRIRWKIELIFKTWKSLFNLQLNLKGHKETRIECFVYTMLILALLTTMIHGWLKRIGLDVIGKEISLDRLSKWLLNRQGYFWLLWQSISELEEAIQKDLRSIRRQTRKRKTTLERVSSYESYSEKFNIVNF